MRSPAFKLSGGTAINKLLKIRLLASKHINYRVAWAGISVAFWLIAMLARSQFKRCRLIFLGRIYSAFLSATESQNLNEIGRRDSPNGAIRLTAIASLARTRTAPMSEIGFCACSTTNTAVFNWMKYR
ncbi:hypothetical protein [Microcoleus vaginatus]|uniref:hypothetical protein n=1 Tax=Microcoleus vaginatus TaxID=119532 RepID=UPI0032A5D004